MQMILPATALSKWFVGNKCRSGIVGHHELGPRTVLSTAFQVAGKIHCISGLIWITRDGGGEDILLCAGESLVCDRHDRLVVEALETAVMEITELSRRSLPRSN
jgi:hypothetical protein